MKPKSALENRPLASYDVREPKGGSRHESVLGGGCDCWRRARLRDQHRIARAAGDFEGIRDYFVRAAEKMPEATYGFKPSPDVRSFGQIVAHVADDQYNLCGPAKGETRKAAYTAIEDTLSRKADLVAALKEAFELVTSGKRRTKFSMLNWNLWHTWEPYGNVVVYLRIKGLVPPSSEGMKMK